MFFDAQRLLGDVHLLENVGRRLGFLERMAAVGTAREAVFPKRDCFGREGEAVVARMPRLAAMAPWALAGGGWLGRFDHIAGGWFRGGRRVLAGLGQLSFQFREARLQFGQLCLQLFAVRTGRYSDRHGFSTYADGQ